MYETEENAWRRYGQELLREVGCDIPGHDQLMEQLHETSFIFSIPHDANRESDGKFLRTRDVKNSGRECSVLEMLVALALRTYDEYLCGTIDSPSDIFVEMLDNLGLMRYKDRVYDDVAVAKILDRWLNRRYGPDGRGGIFPLRDAKNDVRNVSIWDQMIMYVYENF